VPKELVQLVTVFAICIEILRPDVGQIVLVELQHAAECSTIGISGVPHLKLQRITW
jgi:hypothetical protein